MSLRKKKKSETLSSRFFILSKSAGSLLHTRARADLFRGEIYIYINTHTRALNKNVFVVIHDVVLFVVRAHEILRDAILEIRLVEEFQSKAQQFFFFGESVLRSGEDECDDGGVGALPGGRGD